MKKCFLISALLGAVLSRHNAYAQNKAQEPQLRSTALGLQFSRDGRFLLAAPDIFGKQHEPFKWQGAGSPPWAYWFDSKDNRLRVYESATGKMVWVLPTRPIRDGQPQLLLLPDFKTMITSWGAREVKAVDIHSYKVTKIIPVSSGIVGESALSRDESTFVVGMAGSVEIRDYPSQKVRHTFIHGAERTHLSFGPTDNEILCWWGTKWTGVQAQCVDIATGKQIHYPRWVYRVRGADVWKFSPDGKKVALAKGKNIEVWTTPIEDDPGVKLQTLSSPFVTVRALAFSPDAKKLAVGGDSTTKSSISIFDLKLQVTS